MDDYLLQKKMELMIQLATKKQSEEIKLLKDQIERFKEELVSLKEQKNQHLEKNPARGKEVSLEPHPNHPAQPARIQSHQQEIQRSEPRNKCQIPPELAIDKVFYCGNKRF